MNGRPYDYKNKRSQEKKKNSIAITLEEYTKTLFAFMFGPDDMSGGTAKLLDAGSSGLYSRLFPEFDSPIADSEFSRYAGIYFACDYVKQLWEALRMAKRVQGSSLHPALERKGLVFFAVGELERKGYAAQGWNLDADLKKLAKPNDWFADTSHTRSALSKAFDIASKVLIQQYDQRKKSNANFKHRNWFRDQETLQDLRMGLDMALEFGHAPKLWN